jgi:2-dehydro-3-deoxygalactonokinase
MGEGSVVLSERQEPSGVMAITARAGASGTPYKVAFGRAFEALCGEWLGSVPGLPVIACGMVGRNQGWVEAEYRTIPTDLAANGLVLTPVRTQAGPTVHIVPGLIVNSALPGGNARRRNADPRCPKHDLKAGTVDYAAHRIVLLPGTHSKWVRITGTTVTDFTTCMTARSTHY